MGEREDLIDSVIAELNLSGTEELPKDHTVLSLWIEQEMKKKYDELQSRTNKEFAKGLKHVVYAVINRAWEKV